MKNIKEYAGGLMTFVKVAAIITAIVGFVAYLTLMMDDATRILSLVSLVGTVVAVLFWFALLVVAGWGFDIAVDKGYNQGKYAWILYFLPAIGWMLVIAMPDKPARPKVAPKAPAKPAAKPAPKPAPKPVPKPAPVEVVEEEEVYEEEVAEEETADAEETEE